MCHACAFGMNDISCRRINREGQLARLENGFCPDAGIYVGSIIELRDRVKEGETWSFKEKI